MTIYVTLWFILTNGSGYIPPLDVRPTDTIIQCGLSGAIVGVQVNQLQNPTKALWPDPHQVDKHCEVDITGKMASLEAGEYHLATTINDDGSEPGYRYHDPHTSDYFFKTSGPIIIPTPLNVKVGQ